MAISAEQASKRKTIMQRSMALGHCVCNPKKPCPCDVFRSHGICECAGERLPMPADNVRLTEHVRAAGCASKISKKDLQEALRGLPELTDPRVIVGATAGDDAGVIRLSPETETILTVDVFAPSVDDPYTFGQIAAANSLSDIYAMGGTPQAALSIVGIPAHELPLKAMHDILRGGADKMQEAGVPVVGGHSINDAEVKCGFAVLGTAPADGCIQNRGAQVGDAVVLTKPLGVGIMAFGGQIGRAPAGGVEAISRSMARLNRVASELMRKHGAHAATDVTGFSLLGHMAEIVRHSGVAVELDFESIPLFEGVAELAQQDVLPGAVERNRESVDPDLLDLGELSPAQQALLLGPETSGGLLIFLPAAQAEALVADLHSADAPEAAVIGRVSEACPGGRIQAITREPLPAIAIQPQPSSSVDTATVTAPAPVAAAGASCCADGPPAAPAAPRTDTRAEAGDPMPAPAAGDAFKSYMSAVNRPNAIDAKNKKLMSLALSVVTKCEPCTKLQVKAARDAGATEEEIAEAVALAVAFGGAPVGMFYNTLRMNQEVGRSASPAD